MNTAAQAPTVDQAVEFKARIANMIFAQFPNTNTFQEAVAAATWKALQEARAMGWTEQMQANVVAEFIESARTITTAAASVLN